MPKLFSASQLRHSQELSTDEILSSGNYLIIILIALYLKVTQIWRNLYQRVLTQFFTFIEKNDTELVR